MGKKRTNFVLREPVVEEKRQVFAFACGHEDLAKASSDPNYIARELGCQRCRSIEMTWHQGVKELSYQELVERGKKCRKLAEQGIPYWERQLQIVLREWRTRATEGM